VEIKETEIGPKLKPRCRTNFGSKAEYVCPVRLKLDASGPSVCVCVRKLQISIILPCLLWVASTYLRVCGYVCLFSFLPVQAGDPLSRNLNDAEALKAKVAAKQSMLAEKNETGSSVAPVVRKKVAKEVNNSSLDDLLAAGLPKKKSAK
jgi:hypothetical protein